MGKQKKGFNWKARQQGGTLDTDAVARLKGKVSLAGVDQESLAYAGSNALALPQQKLKFKKAEATIVGKILSKKQRKRLEKIVDVKKKKEERSSLLEALQAVQVSSLAGLESLSSVQTKGVKRQLVESKEVNTAKFAPEEADTSLSVENIGTKKKKRKVLITSSKKSLAKRDDLVGFTSSESSSSEDEEEVDGHNNAALNPKATMEDNVRESPKKISPLDCEQNVQEAGDRIKEEDFKAKIPTVPAEETSIIKPDSCLPVGLERVVVNRPPGVEEARARLPVVGEEQVIMETIGQHQVTVLSGETGSGKTTQLPQFLFEAGYASQGRMIGVTEPRRVAATAMANRVAHELNLPTSKISYQIRYEGNVTEDTKVKFMTDGVLLREVEKDFLLSKYSVIIIDEAHERSVFTDILIGLLSRIVPLRHKKGNPLKLVIMSATLRVGDFTENTRLFKTPPPLINVESRQFPVTVHFNKTTREDYLGEAFRKVCKIHRELPEGGVLVFLTGQQEVNTLVRKLRQRFPSETPLNLAGGKPQNTGVQKEKKRIGKKSKALSNVPVVLPEVDLSNYSIQPLEENETDVLVEEDEDEEEELGIGNDEEDAAESGATSISPLHVLPLYSLLSSEKQAQIFAGAPPGSRLCVVATNVAETSLTIPGVKYVIDCGKVKTKHWDKVTGVTTFLVEWTSKAQADQRAGRAGRQGAGHAYRLYSSAVFNNDMKDFSVPEMQQRPVDDLLLQMKSMNIEKVVNFPFPTPPDLVQLREGERRLQLLGALSSLPPNITRKEAEKQQFLSKVTALGRAIAAFPLAPRFGKMLALAHQHDLLGLSLTLVAALAVQEVLVERGLPGDETERKTSKEVMELRRRWAGQNHCLQLGDAMVLLGGVLAAERAGYCPRFCAGAGLRPKAMQEIRRLRKQLAVELERLLPGESLLLQRPEAPSQEQARLLAQLLLAGSPDMVARRVPPEEGGEKEAYRAGAMQQMVFIHPSSVLRRKMPEWVVYQELFETDTGKILMRGVTAIDPAWLPALNPGLCTLGEPLDKPSPRYCPNSGRVMATYGGTFGSQAWPLPPTEQEMTEGTERFKWFARFILEGSVAPELKKFSTSLLSNPLIMVKSWSNLQKRTELILRELASKKVTTGKELNKAWREEPNFLLSAFLSWLPEALHPDARAIWPPTISTNS